MTAEVTLAGAAVTSARLHVPPVGPWFADVELDVAVAEAAPGSRADLRVGARTLRGTVAPLSAGAFALGARVRLVAGAGGWGALAATRGYHNDAGVLARVVADDAARAAGETLGGFAPAGPRLGVDYARAAGAASGALEDAIGGAAWWVDYDGVTQVGARPEVEANPDAYEVLEYDPRQRVATLAVDDLSAVVVGSLLLNPALPEAQRVRELAVSVEHGAIRLRAWTGGTAPGRGRAANALRALLAAVLDRRIYGPRRYRVVELSEHRATLQAVERDAGLPDLGPLSYVQGLAGSHSALAAGAEVLVQFVDGDPEQPIVTHFAGRDAPGWTPSETWISVSTLLRLGSETASHPAAKADTVDPRVNAITLALDAFAAGVPVAGDGGAALQTALKVAGGWGASPHSAINSGSSKVNLDG